MIGQSLREVLAYHAQAIGDPTRPLSHLVDPTYGEYRRVSKHNELRAKVWGEHVLGWEQDVFPSEANGIFWTGHPENPTGRAWHRATLAKFVDQTQGLLTIVDEAYLPFFPDEAERTMVGEVVGRENLLVLRSLSSFYAIPGLRVGYAVGSPDMVTRLRQYQDPWSVPAHAEAAALAALDDPGYRERSVRAVAEESKRLVDRLWDDPRAASRLARSGPAGFGPAACPITPSSRSPRPIGTRSGSRRRWLAEGSSSANAPTFPVWKSARS